MMDYLVVVKKFDDGHKWVLTHQGDVMSISPPYKTEQKCVIEALFFSTVFGVELLLPEEPKPQRHLRLVTDD